MLLERYMEEAAAAAAERKRLLGRRIAAARKARGWKQRHLAQAMSVENMTVSRWDPSVPM